MATKKVSELTKEEKQNLVEKLGDALKEFDIDAEIKTVRQCVCPLKETEVQNIVNIIVEKKLGPEFSEIVAKFNEKVKEIIQNIEDVQVSVNIDLGAGSPYETIKNVTPLNEESAVNLEHKKGEVWLVDFWATWCPPCQKPMAHNQEMLEKRQAEWGDKLRIIGVSIDQDKTKLKDHVNTKGWTKVEHYWRDKSDCSKQYNVQGVPCVMLIDQNGKIVFKGHPASRSNLEQDFDDLLAGKEIIVAKEEDEDEEQNSKELSQDQVDSYNKEIDSFREQGLKLQQNENIKTHSQSLNRAFCVMVLEQSYNPKTQKSSGTYQNFRVLVGPQKDIDGVSEILQREVNGSFEVVKREQAI